MEKNEEQAYPDQNAISIRLTFFVVGLCGLLVVARFITSFLPHLRAWGINHLAYLPLWVRVSFVLLSFCVFVPKFNRGIRSIARKVFSFITEQIPRPKRFYWYAIASLVSMGIFWAFRCRTHFLGDGCGLVATLDAGDVMHMWSEIGETMLYGSLHKLLNVFSSVDTELTFQVGSILAGGIFVFLALWISDHLGKDLFEKVFVFSILATMGSILLFFGYVERYSFVSLAVLGYVFSSVKWIEERGKIVVPILLFVLAVALHLSSFFLLPSLIYLFLLTGQTRITATKLLLAGVVMLLALALVSLYVYFYKPRLEGVFVLPFQHEFTSRFSSGYTSFSLTHLLDMVNELFLLSMAGVILILTTLVVAYRKIHITSPRMFFLLLVVGFGLIFHFTLDPRLGAAKDWDMFAITSIGYAILGITLFLHLGLRTDPLKYACVVLVWTSFLSLAPWIAVNASEPRAVQRFGDLLELDPMRSKSGRFVLIGYWEKKGMTDEVEKETMRQFEIFPHLHYAKIATQYYTRGVLDTALSMLRIAHELDPLSPEVHYHLGKVHQLQGNLDSAGIEYELALKSNPEDLYARHALAVTYMDRQLWDQALSQYKMILRFRKQDPEVHYNMGIICLHQNRPHEAVKHFKEAIDIDHDYVLAKSGLAFALWKTGQVEDAVKEYENVIQLKPDFADAYFYLGYLYRQMGQNAQAKASWEQFLRLSKDPRQSEEIRNALQSLPTR
jgi:tetratricopeptide (TPR) repeat protein